MVLNSSDYAVLDEKWNEKWNKLEEDYDKFQEYFDKHRTCKCKEITDCRHFDRAIKIFDKRLDELDNLNSQIFSHFLITVNNSLD